MENTIDERGVIQDRYMYVAVIAGCKCPNMCIMVAGYSTRNALSVKTNKPNVLLERLRPRIKPVRKSLRKACIPGQIKINDA